MKLTHVVVCKEDVLAPIAGMILEKHPGLLSDLERVLTRLPTSEEVLAATVGMTYQIEKTVEQLTPIVDNLLEKKCQ